MDVNPYGVSLYIDIFFTSLEISRNNSQENRNFGQSAIDGRGDKCKIIIMTNNKIVETNSQGWQLQKRQMFWAIVKPGLEANNVAHVGKREYILKIWSERYEGK